MTVLQKTTIGRVKCRVNHEKWSFSIRNPYRILLSLWLTRYHFHFIWFKIEPKVIVRRKRNHCPLQCRKQEKGNLRRQILKDREWIEKGKWKWREEKREKRNQWRLTIMLTALRHMILCFFSLSFFFVFILYYFLSY